MMTVAELLHSIVERTPWTEQSHYYAAHEAVDEHFGDKAKTDESVETVDSDKEDKSEK